jgi:hypothetical protein
MAQTEHRSADVVRRYIREEMPPPQLQILTTAIPRPLTPLRSASSLEQVGRPPDPVAHGLALLVDGRRPPAAEPIMPTGDLFVNYPAAICYSQAVTECSAMMRPISNLPASSRVETRLRMVRS